MTRRTFFGTVGALFTVKRLPPVVYRHTDSAFYGGRVEWFEKRRHFNINAFYGKMDISSAYPSQKGIVT